MILTTLKGMSLYHSLNLLHDCPLLRIRNEISEVTNCRSILLECSCFKAGRNTVCICRLVLEPRQQACMHNTEAARVDEVNIRPFGYQWSVPISIPKLYESQEPRSYPIHLQHKVHLQLHFSGALCREATAHLHRSLRAMYI